MSNATRPSFITCARCHEQSDVAGDGPIPTYCGATCRSAANKARAKVDGRAAEWERRRLARQAAAQEAREQVRLANARPCPYCSAPMTNPQRVQCGAPACKLRFHSERQQDFQNKHKAEHGVYYSRQYDKPKQIPITCAQCGIDAVVTKTTAKYCSHACWYDACHAANVQSHSQVELWRPKRRTLRVQVFRIRKPIRRCWYSACCPMCDTWFVTDNPKYQYCTARCGRKATKDRRRALERAAYVAPVSRPQVYARDGWTCQLCQRPVPRTEVVPHPQAPTLDHIIPLSRGGTHEPANVQLAHYLCNSIKSDGVRVNAGRLIELGIRLGGPVQG